MTQQGGYGEFVLPLVPTNSSTPLQPDLNGRIITCTYYLKGE